MFKNIIVITVVSFVIGLSAGCSHRALESHLGYADLDHREAALYLHENLSDEQKANIVALVGEKLGLSEGAVRFSGGGATILVISQKMDCEELEAKGRIALTIIQQQYFPERPKHLHQRLFDDEDSYIIPSGCPE